MTPPVIRHGLTVAVLLVLGACATGRPATRPLTPAQLAARDGGIPPYTAADVAFMQGMIGHHAQAVTMSSFAVANGAGPEVKVLAGRISVAQTDEIAFMKTWLSRRKQAVPAGDMADMAHAHHAGMDMATMGGNAAGSGMMPGMLSPAQMDTLQAAKGPAFDWYFLTFMIQHHRGAISMVDELMAAKGAANDDDVFKFVSDVVADQSTEIDRMELLLKSRPRP
ncbi:MAG: DUF305 domain-containing protein [Gemmatimonadota bacterium]|nr:DUF305 domain-containing protein [Gemmatimonadota bacterium]